MAVSERTKLGQFGAKMCQIFGERQVAAGEQLESTSIQLDLNVFEISGWNAAEGHPLVRAGGQPDVPARLGALQLPVLSAALF
jgi:hypothetical protein